MLDWVKLTGVTAAETLMPHKTHVDVVVFGCLFGTLIEQVLESDPRLV